MLWSDSTRQCSSPDKNPACPSIPHVEWPAQLHAGYERNLNVRFAVRYENFISMALKALDFVDPL